MKLYVVYDSKAEAYVSPHFVKSNGIALRAFTDAANDTQTELYKHPGDYTLFCVGEFNEETGEMVPYAAKINLGMASEVKKQMTFEKLQAQLPLNKPQAITEGTI